MFLSDPGTAAFESLRDLLLEIAQERELSALLPLVVRRLAESSEAVALARIWLLGPGDSCATCENAEICASREQCLHLEASAMRPRGGPVRLEARLAGTFRRIPIGELKVGDVVTDRRAVVVAHASTDPRILGSERVRDESIDSFGGQPLLYRDHVVGVLGVFVRQRLTPSAIDWLGVLANHAAAAIASARAFDEIARMHQRLQRENEYLREVVASSDDFTTLVGSSPAIYHVTRQIDLVAPTNATVLVYGEPGTGKELVAEAIHRRSRRAGEAFVRVRCATMPAELGESELFGHVRGAFPGALTDRVGRFEAADGGTLFLDEVAAMPMNLQTRLLRVLNEGEIERVGEKRPRRANVRVVAATSRDLAREAAEGRLREDLHSRLRAFPIEIPPLRDRSEDLALVAAQLIAEVCRRMHRETIALGPEELAELEKHDWPGNVRELLDVLERAVIDTPRPSSRLALAPLGGVGGGRTGARANGAVRAHRARAVLPEADVRRFERENLLAALELTGGRVYGRGGAADLLGLKPTTLASRMKKLGVAARS